MQLSGNPSAALPGVDVCICTFRRPSVVQTLESVAAQDRRPEGMRVIVCDNDETPTAREAVEAAARRLGLDLTYIHAPARNIALARNACLDASQATLTAFLDDDEEAHPHWLGALMDFMAETGADAAFGPVDAVYPPQAPRWAAKADLHSARPQTARGAPIPTGYVGNVMLRRSVVGTLRFDLGDGRTGGEDTRFFEAMVQRGARLLYCPEASVSEPTPLARIRMAWLLRRSFRAGQTHGEVLMSRGSRRGREAAVAFAKAVASGVQAMAALGSQAGWRQALVRGALHVGVVARLSGIRPLRLY